MKNVQILGKVTTCR